MQTKYNYIFSGFIFCLLFSGIPNSFAQHLPQEFEKKYKIDIVYSANKSSITQDYEVIINNNGDIIVSENNYYDKSKVLNGRLSDSELEGLKNFIIEENIFRFDNEYIGKDFIKLDSERLKVTINGRTKEILISAAPTPPEIRAIINAIEKFKARLEPAEEEDPTP